jgi:beta-xylosidase
MPKSIKKIRVRSLVAIVTLIVFQNITAYTQTNYARNPIIRVDYPDPAVIRAGDAYYISITTIHMCPGWLILTISG